MFREYAVGGSSANRVQFGLGGTQILHLRHPHAKSMLMKARARRRLRAEVLVERGQEQETAKAGCRNDSVQPNAGPRETIQEHEV